MVKRLIICSCFFLFSFALSGSTDAVNVSAMTQGIVYIDGETAYHSLAPTDNDVSITSETLAFDFSSFDISPYDETQAVPSTLTTTLNLSNSGSDKTVHMGFPFVTSFRSLPLKNIQISGSGGPLSYTPSYGKIVDGATQGNDPTYEDPDDLKDQTLEEAIEQTIPEESLLSDTLTLTTYSLDFSQMEEQDAVIKFKADLENSHIFNDRQSAFKINDTLISGDRSVTLSYPIKYLTSTDMVSFSILGEDLKDLKVYGTNDAQKTLVTYATDAVITRGTLSLADKVSELTSTELARYEKRYDSDLGDYVDAVTLDPILAERLLAYETFYALDGQFYQTFPEIMDQAWAYSRIVLIVYDVPLAHGENTVTISQPYFAGMDFRYEPTVYDVNYVIQPAKQWSSFGSLTISVIPPEDFVVAENPDFILQQDGSFAYTYDSLPEDTFVLNLCTVTNPENSTNAFWNFLSDLFNGSMFFITFILAPAITLGGIAVGITFWVIAKKKKKARATKEMTKETKDDK